MNGYMQCPDCGLSIPVDSEACLYCGKKFLSANKEFIS
jgi:DNA-directed RNA polymerase subunit RPC12/RpoP